MKFNFKESNQISNHRNFPNGNQIHLSDMTIRIGNHTETVGECYIPKTEMDKLNTDPQSIRFLTIYIVNQEKSIHVNLDCIENYTLDIR